MDGTIVGYKKVSVSKVIIYVALSLWALTTVYPFFWVIANSFKLKGVILSDSFSLPLGDLFTLENYKLAFRRVDIFGAYRNSIIISAGVTAAVILLAGLAAYALARYNFKGKAILSTLIVAAMMFPVFSTIIPVFRMLNSWGLAATNTLWKALVSVMLPQIAGNLSFSIIVLRGYIETIPVDLEEAGYMEGCNAFQIFFRIVVPITKPSFATVGIFAFLWSYNDLFTQMFMLRVKDQWAITRLLNELTSLEGTNYGLMAAAVALVVVPVILVYIFLQKYIIKGLTAGAIKG